MKNYLHEDGKAKKFNRGEKLLNLMVNYISDNYSEEELERRIKILKARRKKLEKENESENK